MTFLSNHDAFDRCVEDVRGSMCRLRNRVVDMLAREGLSPRDLNQVAAVFDNAERDIVAAALTRIMAKHIPAASALDLVL